MIVKQSSQLYSVIQAAELCGVSRVTLWRWIKAGKLKAYQTPTGIFRIKHIDLERFIKESLSYLEMPVSETRNRILIIDDDTSFRGLVKRILSNDRFEIQEAKNGFETGLKVIKFNPAVLILDLFMPGINGFEICQQIKSDKQTQHIRILAITGYGTPEVKDKILKLGADVFMEKPVQRQDLLKCITTLLKTRSA